MSEFIRPHYRNAPIAEALIDIRVAHPDRVTMEQITLAADELTELFPVRHPMNVIEFGFDFGSNQSNNSQEQAGLRLERENRVLQLQRIGFTYSHLPPYTNWETLRDEALRYWEVFRRATDQSAVSRIAVRVINKIPTPQAEIALEDYLSVYPVVPAKLPATAKAAFVQLQMAMPHVLPAAQAILNVASGHADTNGPHLLLDIDLFAAGAIEGDEAIWNTIDKFGIEKDVIFEACITDKIREAIQ
ncbi:TIGR04255 family protein [Bradyrhizobium sp. 162]|uniref:TIGR04255 family protein n=1 Tax=Bradyrhizobium sp. 162 TaxID=2782635 RepID=UPI001FF830AE|nr:TIGR04255 family protein [Bradyrhizobium sp. 162]MCK1629676.1 TIGR04255 family protein [Bradyrhizobium sp. 162]